MDITEFLNTYLNYSQESTGFIRVLIFLLIFVLVFTIIKRIPQLNTSKLIPVIISLVVAALAIVYIKDETISNFILLPYSTLGFLLVAILPFIIIFLLINRSKMPSAGRKLCWTIFGAIFLYIWYKSKDTFTSMQNTISIGAMIVILIIIVYDKQINEALKKKSEK